MSNDLQPSADAASESAKAIASLAKLVQSGTISIDGIAPAKQAAVRQLLADAARGLSPRRFHAQQNAERNKFFRELAAQGFKVHRASQQDHDFIFDSILDTVDAGVKPAVKPLLRDYAEQQGYAPEWAERVATKTQPKKMRKSLKGKQRHAVIEDLKEGRMFTQTHQSTLTHATYSGLAELLFSGSQSTREKQDMRDRLAALEAKLAVVEAEADRANARLNLMNAGLDWKETARAVLAAEPGISKSELARRVGKSEGLVRKYWALLAQHRGDLATARA